MVQLRLYVSFRNVIKRLSYEEKGMLLDAMLAYAEDKTLLPLEGKADVIWDFVQEMLDAQHKAYTEKCASISEARKKRLDSNMKSTDSNMKSREDNLSLHNIEIQKQIQKQDKLNKSRNGGRERKSNFPEHDPPSEQDLKDFFLNLGEMAKNMEVHE